MAPRRITPPDAPPTPVEQRGEQLGLVFNRGRTWTSNSYLSLQAAEFALRHAASFDDAWRFHRRMFKAYFEDLDDIGDLETVVRIGADAGLDSDALRLSLTEGQQRERVDEGISWTKQIGVTAIPTFVFNERFAMVGAQELPAFRSIMERLGIQPRA